MKNMFWIITVAILFLWRADTFLLNPGTTSADGLTESHFITVMNLLLEEKQQRQHLEFVVNKIYQDLLAANANTTNEVHNLQTNKQYFEQRIGNSTDSLSKSYKDVLTDLVNLKDDNKQLRLQFFKTNNETDVLRKKYDEIQQNFISLKKENKQLKQELNQSKDIMVHLKEELESLTHLKSINQLQDVRDLQKGANATENHLHVIDSQLNKITATQQARDQDFLALYNQTVSIQTALTQKLQKESQGLKNMTNAKTNHTNFVALTSCVPNTRTFRDGDTIIFSNVKTHYGYSNIEAYKRTGKFICTVPGFYLVMVTIMSSTENANFQIFKNSLHLSNGFVSHRAGSETNSGTSEVVTEFELNDTIYVRASYTFEAHDWDSCFTIVKVH